MADFPVLTPAEVYNETEPPALVVHGIVLAAGASERFGERNKLLATVDCEPLVRRATETLLASSIDGVTVVIGHEADQVRRTLGDLPVAFVENPDYASGQAASVRAGVRAAEDHDADGVLVSLGDMPFVSTESIDLLLTAFRRGLGDVVIAVADGRRGNPVVFGQQYFEGLRGLTGDTGGRMLFAEADDVVGVETGDPGVRRDVDRSADLPDAAQNQE